MSEPIDIETLDPLYRDVFRDPENGTPDNISKAGCLALAKLGVDAWNAWREAFKNSREGLAKNNASFENCRFDDPTMTFQNFNFGEYPRFSNCVFDHAIDFENAIFGFGASFQSASFKNECNFRRTTFGDSALFNNAKFEKSVDFCHSRFASKERPYQINFAAVSFRGPVHFSHAKFHGPVSFKGVDFCDGSRFDEATFADGADFSASKTEDRSFRRGNREVYEFLKDTRRSSDEAFADIFFGGASFVGTVNFSNRKFHGVGWFGYSSDKTVFLGVGDAVTRVKDPDGHYQSVVPKVKKKSYFGRAPLFFNCTFNSEVSFEGAEFGEAKGDETAARAYRTLKLAFSQQQAIREEQRFFKLEMAEEAARATGAQRWLYKAYAACSDYGFSVTRPLALLALALLGFSGIYAFFSWVNFCLPSQAACQFNSAWVEFSLLQALPLPGLDKLSEALRAQLVPSNGLVSIGVTLAVILHKAISLLALFLIGLALRNLFKLK